MRGLSDAARLGDIVEHRGRAGGLRSGEIVQIGPDQVLVAPFEHSADAGVGDAVFNRGPFDVAPRCLVARPRRSMRWPRPIDGGAPLLRGERLDAAGDAAVGAVPRARRHRR